jgi:hypothetical protein
VYKPAFVIVPTVELPPVILLTLQVTAVSDVPVTVAVNCSVLPSSTLELVEETATVTDCGGCGVDVQPSMNTKKITEHASRRNAMACAEKDE